MAIIAISPDRMRTHPPKIDGKQVQDSVRKSQSEICSPQDRIAHLYCISLGCNCQHHDREASWHLIAVAMLKIRFRLWYRPMSWFRPPYTTSHPPPPATNLTPLGAWRLQLSKSLDRAHKSIHGSIERLESWMGAYSQAGWESDIECNWEHPWEHALVCAWEHTRRCTWERTGRCTWERTRRCIRDFRLRCSSYCCGRCTWERTRRCTWKSTRRCTWKRTRRCTWECTTRCSWECLECLLGSI